MFCDVLSVLVFRPFPPEAFECDGRSRLEDGICGGLVEVTEEVNWRYPIDGNVGKPVP